MLVQKKKFAMKIYQNYKECEYVIYAKVLNIVIKNNLHLRILIKFIYFIYLRILW